MRHPRLPHRRWHRRDPAKHHRGAGPRPASGAPLSATKRPRNRRAIIVEAAAELFAERGFSAVGIDDIGTAVGVSGPALYRHFKGKDAVLTAVLEVNAARVAAAVAGTSPTAVLRQAVAAALEHPAGLATYLRERHRLTDPPAAMLEHERQIRRAWREALTTLHRALTQTDAELRQAAVIGALGAIAGRPPSVQRPRLDEIVTASATAMLHVPPTKVGPNPPRSTEPTPAWQPSPSKRDAILGVALRRFRERGYHGVSIDELGEAVGITGPTVYHYYANKAEILIDAYDRAGERVAVGADEALASATSAADALERLARSYVGVARDNVDLIVVTAAEQAALPAEAWSRLARRGRVVRDGWTGVIRELRPELSESEARLVVRMALPLVNHAVPVPARPEAIVDLVVAFCRAQLLTSV